MFTCGEYGGGAGIEVRAVTMAGGSIRLAIDGDADARFTCGDA